MKLAPRRRELAQNWLAGGLVALAGLGGLFIALHHPWSPAWLGCAFVAWCLAVFMRPAIWPWVLPALLPISSFSAWTGWIGVEEFDLLVLGAAAGSIARSAFGRRQTFGAAAGLAQPLAADALEWLPPGSRPSSFRLARIALGLLALWYFLSLLHGFFAAGGLPADWFEAYEDPINTLRVGKSFLFALLLLPSLLNELHCRPLLFARRLAAGVATGLGLVGVAILWERAGYPGWIDFSTPYRATALFWEMHVGGAGIDDFLVLSAPFAVYALLHSPTAWTWGAAAALAVIAVYACLTTFSRGVYLGVGVGLAVLGWRLSAPDAVFPPPAAWRRWGNRVLLAALVFEVVAVLGFGDFMSRRLAASPRDLGGRLQHWREGLSLLRGPSEFLFGRGLGRFPANYSQALPARAPAGRLRIIDAEGELSLRLFGYRPIGRSEFALLQRVPVRAGTYRLALDLRAAQLALLRVGICQRHLLYAAACVQTSLWVPGGQRWRHFAVPLAGPPAFAAAWPLPGFLVLRFAGPGAAVDIDNLSVLDAAGRELLRNGDFSEGLANWFFAADHDFLPWHIDNLWLEVLIDQGAIGLLLLLGVWAMALSNLLYGSGRQQVLAPYLLAALCAAAAVGVFSSLFDMPRSAFLFFLLLCSALFLDGRRSPGLPRVAAQRLVHAFADPAVPRARVVRTS